MAKSKQEQLQQALLDFYKNPVAMVSLELIFSILAVVFFAVFAVKPTLQTMSLLVKEIEDKRALDEQLAQKIASLNTAQAQYQQFSSQFYLLDEAMPKTASLMTGLKIVEKIAGNNQLVIKGITISSVPEELVAASASQATRQILTFNVSVIGDYLQIRQFIEDLMNSRRMILVDQINFSLANNRNQKDLGAVIRINLPYYDSQVTEKK